MLAHSRTRRHWSRRVDPDIQALRVTCGLSLQSHDWDQLAADAGARLCSDLAQRALPPILVADRDAHEIQWGSHDFCCSETLGMPRARATCFVQRGLATEELGLYGTLCCSKAKAPMALVLLEARSPAVQQAPAPLRQPPLGPARQQPRPPAHQHWPCLLRMLLIEQNIKALDFRWHQNGTFQQHSNR